MLARIGVDNCGVMRINPRKRESIMTQARLFTVAIVFAMMSAGTIAFAQTHPSPQVQSPTDTSQGMGGMSRGGMGMMGMGRGGMPMMGMGGQGGMGQGCMGMMGRMMGMDMMEMGAGQGGAAQTDPSHTATPSTPAAKQQAMQMPMGPGMMGPGKGIGGSPMGMSGVDRVEGRIAFLRAELKITEQQTAVFNEFADAVRAGAKRHNEMRQHRMSAAPTGMAARLEEHERLLNARLESTRAIRVAVGRLQAGLTDEQRRTLDELVFFL